MKIRTIVAVIVISILIGFGIFYFSKGGSSSALSKTTATFNQQTTSTNSPPVDSTNSYYPSSTPRPTHPPLDKSSDLEAEAEKLDPQDYSTDFENLRDQI